MINIVLSFCGGKGCRIESFKTQRKLNHAHVKKFVDGAGEDGSGFLVREVENAIPMALPRGSFDLASVTKDPSKVVPIVWTDDAPDMTGIRLGGTHRTEAWKIFHAAKLELFDRLKDIIDVSNRENDQVQAAKARTALDTFLSAFDSSMHWNVKVYDLGTNSTAYS